MSNFLYSKSFEKGAATNEVVDLLPNLTTCDLTQKQKRAEYRNIHIKRELSIYQKN